MQSIFRKLKRTSSTRRSIVKGNVIKEQIVMSNPKRFFLEVYTTKSGISKNRYRKMRQRPVKVIYHIQKPKLITMTK